MLVFISEFILNPLINRDEWLPKNISFTFERRIFLYSSSHESQVTNEILWEAKRYVDKFFLIELRMSLYPFDLFPKGPNLIITLRLLKRIIFYFIDDFFTIKENKNAAKKLGC